MNATRSSPLWILGKVPPNLSHIFKASVNGNNTGSFRSFSTILLGAQKHLFPWDKLSGGHKAHACLETKINKAKNLMCNMLLKPKIIVSDYIYTKMCGKKEKYRLLRLGGPSLA